MVWLLVPQWSARRLLAGATVERWTIACWRRSGALDDCLLVPQWSAGRLLAGAAVVKAAASAIACLRLEAQVKFLV